MQISKAVEISDAKISFVSLVGKAANKKRFLVAKSDGGATFTTFGKVLKMDDAVHHITGIVYEPMTEDTDGNYMTEDEIRKAAFWFAKNAAQVDVQHSFEAADGISVVESYVSPCDMEIGGQAVKKGTWLMTVEVQNNDVWEAVQKGGISGFSMGGTGVYGEVDVPLDEIEKSVVDIDTRQKKGFLKKFAEFLGLEPVEKGEFTDKYNEQAKGRRFWDAFSTLQDILRHYDPQTNEEIFAVDEDKINTALMEFSAVLTALLKEKDISKALKKSAPNKKHSCNP